RGRGGFGRGRGAVVEGQELGEFMVGVGGAGAGVGVDAEVAFGVSGVGDVEVGGEVPVLVDEDVLVIVTTGVHLAEGRFGKSPVLLDDAATVAPLRRLPVRVEVAEDDVDAGRLAKK